MILKRFNSKVNGSTFCGGQVIIGTLKEGDVLLLEREPKNEYDTNAVAIIFGAKRIGYIPKDTAASLSLDMDKGLGVTCKVQEITGGNGKMYGCNILVEVHKD